MSEQRKKRKLAQNSRTDPENFTCGMCRRISRFRKIQNDQGFFDHLCQYCDADQIAKLEA